MESGVLYGWSKSSWLFRFSWAFCGRIGLVSTARRCRLYVVRKYVLDSMIIKNEVFKTIQAQMLWTRNA
jgi:hypothetical protein